MVSALLLDGHRVSLEQPTGLLGSNSFSHQSRAIWFKIPIKAAMLISYIGSYFLITVPQENLGRRRGEPSAPPLRKPVCRLQLPVLLEASAQSLAFQLTPAHTALPCSSGLCPDAEDGPVGPAGDGEAGANWGSSTERQQLAGGERLLTRGGGQRSAATERWEARAQQGGARGKGHVCSGQFTLVYSGNQHNLVKQLFSNYNSLKEDAKEKKRLLKHHLFYEAFLDQAPPPPYHAHFSSCPSPPPGEPSCASSPQGQGLHLIHLIHQVPTAPSTG